MTKTLDTVVGFLAGIAFLWIGIAIGVWDVGKIKQSRASRDWPHVEGRVIESRIDARRSAHRPLVVYEYAVDGRSYISKRISFDLFDKPGGSGRLETIVARYKPAQAVRVFYDPKDPSVAVLEREVYSPFLMPMLFAAIFTFGGLGMLIRALLRITNREAAASAFMRKRRQIAATSMASILLYSTLIMISFEGAASETFEKAFGPRPLGIPTLAFVIGLQTLLFLPVPWFTWHFQLLTFQAIDKRWTPSDNEDSTKGESRPDLSTSKWICLGGLLYFAVICMTWIAYATAVGV